MWGTVRINSQTIRYNWSNKMKKYICINMLCKNNKNPIQVKKKDMYCPICGTLLTEVIFKKGSKNARKNIKNI